MAESSYSNKSPNKNDLDKNTLKDDQQDDLENSELPIKESKGKGLVLKILLGLVLVIILGGATYWFVGMNKPETNRRGRGGVVERSNLEITISANGTIQPEKLINASPKTSGRLKSLVVQEGDQVKEGQILAYMDDSNLQGQIKQAQGQLASAQANLQKLIAGNRPQDIMQAQAALANSQATLRQAEANFRQNQDLYSSGVISQRDFETSRTARDNAQAQVKVQEQILALQKIGSRPEDIDQGRSQVEAAQGALEIVQAQLEDTIIRAAFAGTVIKKYADPGAFVTPTTSGSAVSSATASSILSLSANNQVVANVAERDIRQVKLGQKVSIQADAYPNQEFSGVVQAISPQTTVTQNVTSFEVKINITDDSKQLLRSGMNVNVNFQVGQLANVLTVPTVAIARQTKVTGVYLRRGRDKPPEFVPIEIGLTVGDRTEVKSGLKEGDRVLITFPEGLRPNSAAGRNNTPGLPSSPSDPSSGRRRP
ncbi:RND family efflux transporter, MFP subunit [Synechococcus sp. PCC 7502]|uniref:efflux RND transporter periplasmic adaptor subunit n=1 Tax=Synechococcus sp. PCC 7502 TaxID=1173263 RepID=UPI00029FDD31|nr:efflux RND transporter periplasmic adaptor subunit [Synechococcus sp. PCC 7502]AFY72986.1 RND family efflux transporter, MFP subunit [Synechococcus sp. PCC 7502]